MGERDTVGRELANRLLEALGLSGHPVKRLVITLGVNEPLTVDVTEYIRAEAEAPLGDALEQEVTRLGQEWAEFSPHPHAERTTRRALREADEPAVVEPRDVTEHGDRYHRYEARH